MAPGRKQLQRIQLGKEVTPGTSVACTTVWRGMGNMLDDQRTVEEVEELVGIFGGMDRTNITKLMGGLELAATPLNPEQFPYLLAMGLGGPTTGVTVAGAGSPTGKEYLTNIPVSSGVTVTPYTIRAGDDFEAELMGYSLVTKITVEGKSGESAKMSATLIGRSVDVTTFSGGATIPSVIDDLLVGKGKIYLDAVSGAYGTTQVSNAILGFKVDIEPTWEPKFTMDGNLYYSYAVFTGVKITGELTYEHDTSASGTGGAKQFFRDQTPKLLRINLPGTALATPGSSILTKLVNIDLPIKFNKPGVLEDQNGNDLVKMSFRSRYNATAANSGKVQIVNELSTLP